MRKNTIRRGFSLKHKIVGSFIILVLFSSLLIGFYTYYKAKANIESAVGNTELSVVNSIVNTIDTEKFNNLTSKDDMNSEYYKELQTHLSDIRSTTGLKFLYTMRKTSDGKYIYVVDGLPIDDKNFSSLGDVEEDMSKSMAKSFDGTPGYELNTNEWGHLMSAFIPIKDKSGNVIGMLGADFTADGIVNQLDKLSRNMIIIIFIVIVIGILAGQAISSLLVRSLNKLKNNADLVKEGDLSVKFDKFSTDEVGELTQSFSNMVSNLLNITNEIKINTKNVTYEIDTMYKSFTETSKATEEITDVISRIATGTFEQTNNVDKVSQSMNDVFKQVQKSVDYANLVSDSSNEAMLHTTKALDIFKTSIEKVITVNRTIENTANIIEELGYKSKEINSFSETISQITKQTNLLSLNASIEAARAGEQGKGFAVVANEIKMLAEQSNKASSQISEIASTMQSEIDIAIKTIQDGVIQANDGVNSVTAVDTYLLELMNSSNDANKKAKDIIASINLIESNCRSAVEDVYELADISNKLSAGSQQAAASTEEQSAIVNQLNKNLDNIRQMMSSLGNVVNKFKLD
ncbi:methyl-accepting chemotaxis protein [Clostridium sp. 'White wine YQ']|uniref:methyl-accepting chemotaxis protein n=1 Tax=Clostridium sp. 'White wine YQ' TaxID=3027474 RepID=UPI0023661180|nr:methyl-accepting chemotaxis protein [Clostridium sp. 'White wine YQ']MDD7795485.1 methyl-accepting chemotaxis protein [Clostridium sp. 'White wine YQ']